MNYKKFYKVSYDLLLEMAKEAGISQSELKKKYLTCKMPSSLKEIFDIMVGSATNAQRKSNTLKYFGNGNKHDEYKKLLFDFDYDKVLKKFKGNEVKLKSDIKKISQSKGDKFCIDFAHSIIDSANFLSEFKTINEFKKFLNSFDLNIHTRLALPLLLKAKVRGFGFALACNFLKEIGCTYYSKPDVHIMKVLSEIGQCEYDEIEAFLALDRIAVGCNKTQYEVDKIIWLICSGTFYNNKDKKTGKEVKIKGRRDELINKLKIAI